jgi:hypothetical protein
MRIWRVTACLLALSVSLGSGCARDPLRGRGASDAATSADADAAGDAPADLFLSRPDALAAEEHPVVVRSCPGRETRVEIQIGELTMKLSTVCPPSLFPGLPFEAGAFSYTAFADDEGGTHSFLVYACGEDGSSFDLTIALENITPETALYRGGTLLVRDGAGTLSMFPKVIAGMFEVPIPNYFDRDTALGTVFSGGFSGEATEPGTGVRVQATGRFQACHVWNGEQRF